ncbi:MAG TPA: cytochrome C oxidase subunit IV family protein [Gemmataceae bacterium]|nr:cytochrome C oxidase subunit IV family protein [Gemmataceae bacterium]
MSQHVVKPTTYYLVFATLIVLTLLTVGLSRVEMAESLHTLIGLTIAVAKASLVILFFMHLFYSTRLTWVVALSGLLWLGILITYTMTDYLTRNWDTISR